MFPIYRLHFAEFPAYKMVGRGVMGKYDLNNVLNIHLLPHRKDNVSITKTSRSILFRTVNSVHTDHIKSMFVWRERGNALFLMLNQTPNLGTTVFCTIDVCRGFTRTTPGVDVLSTSYSTTSWPCMPSTASSCCCCCVGQNLITADSVFGRSMVAKEFVVSVWGEGKKNIYTYIYILRSCALYTSCNTLLSSGRAWLTVDEHRESASHRSAVWKDASVPPNRHRTFSCFVAAYCLPSLSAVRSACSICRCSVSCHFKGSYIEMLRKLLHDQSIILGYDDVSPSSRTSTSRGNVLPSILIEDIPLCFLKWQYFTQYIHLTQLI